MLTSIWNGVKATGRFLSDMFNEPPGPSAEVLQYIANDRVSRFRDAIANHSIVTKDHQILEGRDVLARADKLGIAMGIHPDLDRNVEHAVGPGVAVARTNFQAYAISGSADGLEYQGTPFIIAPEALGDKNIKDMYVKKLKDLCDEVEGYRADPKALAQDQKRSVEFQLNDKRYDDKAAYESIVRNARIEEKDIFRPAENYEGQAYVTQQGAVLTKQRALENLLGRSPDSAQTAPSTKPASGMALT